MELEAKRPADVDLPVKSQATSASDDQQVNYSDEPSIDNDAKPASASTGETARPRKSISSRLFRSAKLNFFSSLARRIFIFNLIALTALIGAILYLNQFRAGLIDARIESLQTQGNIIAGALASSARADPDSIIIDPDKLFELQTGESLKPKFDPLDFEGDPLDPQRIGPVLRALVSPTLTRARIYDPTGIQVIDTRNLYGGGLIQRRDLPNPNEDEDFSWSQALGDFLTKLLRPRDLPVYKEITGPGTEYPEVASALLGNSQPVVRVTEAGTLTVSVAVPIQRFRVIMGVLLLSTKGNDIDQIITDERLAILRIFLVAVIVMMILSILLASTIATPLRKLSGAAIQVKRGIRSRVEIPDFSYRLDEIGDLSSSIGEMTNSLYQRIEAIERFAADVSHELKNPLTSLRSAVETLPLVKTDEARQKLLGVIQHDVKRLDRLITDISDASRLDADLVREDVGRMDFGKLVSDIAAATSEVAKRKHNITVNCHIEQNRTAKQKGYFVSGHDLRLAQVINNLLDNASSFVPENTGQIDIRLTRDAAEITLVVEDNGPGIAAENTNRIFERFYTDRSKNDGFGQNSGLGLSISKQIVEAHGGRISAENRKDHTTGARLIVTLPADNNKK